MATKYRIVEETNFDNQVNFYIEVQYEQQVWKENTYGDYRNDRIGGGVFGAQLAAAQEQPTKLKFWQRASPENYDTFAKAKETLDRLTFKPKLVYHDYPVAA